MQFEMVVKSGAVAAGMQQKSQLVGYRLALKLLFF